MTIDNFALIIGSMKSGTTSLFKFLSQHPQIAGSTKKEPNFFSYDENWNKGFEWYLQEWQDWNPQQHKIALEATINYTKYPVYPNVAERIYQLTDRANFKFIYIMRNPIERIESHYTYALTTNKRNDIKKLEEDLNIDQELIETSKYAKQISEYYQRFPKDSILLVNFDDFKQDNLKVLKKICSFLDIENNFKFQGINIIHNPTNKRFMNDATWQYLRKIPPLRKIIKKSIPEKPKRLLHGLFGNKVQQNFHLSPEQKQLIIRQLEEDLYVLDTNYGFNISQWNIKI
jgi:hypothetical protein